MKKIILMITMMMFFTIIVGCGKEEQSSNANSSASASAAEEVSMGTEEDKSDDVLENDKEDQEEYNALLVDNSESNDSESVSTESSTVIQMDNKPSINTNTSTEVKYTTYSSEDIKNTFRELWNQAMTFAANDEYEKFKALFSSSTPESEITACYSAAKSVYEKKGPNCVYEYIYGDNTYAVLLFYSSETYNVTTTHTVSKLMGMSVCDGTLLLDMSSKAQALIHEYRNAMDPDEYWTAKNAGRNAKFFSINDYSWAYNIVIPDAVTTDVYYAWQEDDGSVTLVVNIKNGTSSDRVLTDLNISITDQVLGEVINTTLSNVEVPAKYSASFMYNLSDYEVKTGTAPWTDITYQCTYAFN